MLEEVCDMMFEMEQAEEEGKKSQQSQMWT
jgi:hypothetical protein